jgi:Na+-transporting NADH:ubiquinone oxidoreductase subunit NqrF
LHSGRRREIYALFGFRNSCQQPFKERLESLARDNPNLHLQVSYSAPQAGDVLHRDYVHRGRITIDRVREVLPSNNFHFYMCGPGPMLASLLPSMLEWGVPESHAHYEAFGPTSLRCASGGATANKQAKSCEVRFDRSQRTMTWDGAFNSLLEFGEAAGVTMPSGCRAGSCGECMTAIRSGSVSLLKTPGIIVPDRHCLSCISIPTSELVLDA